jgi:hypothetical protein
MNTFPGLSQEDITKIPSFDRYSTILQSKDRKAISELLAPGIEIYKDDSTYFFKRAFANELKGDYSGIFKLMDAVATMVENTNPHDQNQYEENLRMAVEQDPLHVAKFKSRNSEIVFKYMFGKYLIWEIKLN